MSVTVQMVQITEMMDRLRLPFEPRPLTSDRRKSAPRTMSEQWKATSHVRMLSVYLEPTVYDKGVKFIVKMNRYYLKRDQARFKQYLDMYGKMVMNNSVARFRAMNRIQKLYGDLIVQLP